MEFLALILGLGVIGGIIAGWYAAFQLGPMRREIADLRRRLDAPQPDQPHGAAEAESAAARADAGNVPPSATPPERAPASRASAPAAASVSDSPSTAQPEPEFYEPPPAGPSILDGLGDHLRARWMEWLGGLSVGLAGIFLVRYGIEAGLLGPTARVVIGLLTGVALHAGAEWLRRRNGGPLPAFAALAGGGSITLFAAILAALHLYGLVPPVVAFAGLAIVSISTQWLALAQGPLLAILGILGGYAVPLAVGGDGGAIVLMLGYAALLTASALLLMRHVYRPWLWLGMMAGALAWWWLSLMTVDAAGWRGLYLALLGWLLLAVPDGDWRLSRLRTSRCGTGWRAWLPKQPSSPDSGSRTFDLGLLGWSVWLLVPAYAVTIVASDAPASLTDWLAYLNWLALPALLLLAARRWMALIWLPWLTLVAQVAAWLLSGVDTSGALDAPLLQLAHQASFLTLALLSVAVQSGLSAWNYRAARHSNARRQSALWASLMLFAPLAWLGLAYLVTTEVPQSPVWAAGAAVLATAYIYFGVRRAEQDQPDALTVWLLLAAHLAYCLAAVILLRQASLTLALAIQAVSLTWLLRRYPVGELEAPLGWILKGVLAVVIARLTLNPLLAGYDSTPLWTLWTYGGATLSCGLAAWMIGLGHALRPWLEAATAHLLVLLLWTQTRAWLYDGDVFGGQYTFTEAAINVNLWAALGLLYHHRGQISTHLKPVYAVAAAALLLGALGNYGLLLTAFNPLFGPDSIASTPVFNQLLLAYGLPIGLIWLVRMRYLPRWRDAATALWAVAIFVFVNLEIRHLWQGGLSIQDIASNGELYTYSLVWLLAAVVMLLAGQARHRPLVYKAGIGLLGAVIVKVFLIDMAGLDGLLRVASFMGLGLCLLGLATLLRRSGPEAAESEN